MTLYVRKHDDYVPLTRQQVRRLRRVDQVTALQADAIRLARSTRALASWLASIQKKSLRLDKGDLTVTRLPNVERLRQLCEAVALSVGDLTR